MAAALALGCRVQTTSIFARKNYFYPDLPKGYQISQYERPLALGGGLEVTVDGTASWIGLTRIHMEEDAGKSLHEGFLDSDRQAYVDYNRSGVPLIEIVSEPDMRSAAQAAQFFSQLREILVWLGVNDGNMEEGSLRCDANVSVRPHGQTAFGTKTEVKNVNSFRYLQKAIEYEIERQIDVLAGGGTVRAGDAAVGFRDQQHPLDAQQGRGARLPLLPGAGPAAAGGGRGAGGAHPGLDARDRRRAPAPVRGRLRPARVRRGRPDPVARAGRLLRGRGGRRHQPESWPATG